VADGPPTGDIEALGGTGNSKSDGLALDDGARLGSVDGSGDRVATALPPQATSASETTRIPR
jgi:hypothetical protein